MLERARVGGMDRGVLADQVVLDAAADDEVLEGADRAEREHQGQEQAGDHAFAQPGCARVEGRDRITPASAARCRDLSSGGGSEQPGVHAAEHEAAGAQQGQEKRVGEAAAPPAA